MKPWRDGDAEPLPKQPGTYPPDIARRRRQLGLPVTPEQYAAYVRGETREPPVTPAQMAATLREVAPRCAPALRAVFLELARRAESGRLTAGQAVAAMTGGISREPGEDDDDPAPAWWDR